MPRRPTIYKGSDGLFHCWVTVGKYPNGRPKRKNVTGRTQTVVAEKVAEVERARDTGARLDAKAPTLAEWLTYYLEEIVRAELAPKTYEAYRPIVHMHLIPRIGRYRLAGSRAVLSVENVEACYTDLRRTLAPSYVRQCHRVLSRSLKIAVRRGRAAQNVAALLDGPSVPRSKPRPLPFGTVQKVLAAVGDDRMRARWVLALVLGIRQGEMLGLHWSCVDLDAPVPTLVYSTQAQRQRWRHGCRDPRACAVPHCKTRPCPRTKGRCWRHKRPESCAVVCPAGCAGHARLCPQRAGGGIVDRELKGARSVQTTERVLPLPPMLVDELRAHRRRQAAEREAAASWPHPDLMFVSPAGQRIDPTADHRAWEALLVRAGVPDAPLHAARHSAATYLLQTGTDIDVVAGVLGHTDIRITQGYGDPGAAAKLAAVTRLADALVQRWSATEGHP